MKREPAQGFVMMPFRSDPHTVKFWSQMRATARQFEFLSVQRFGSDSLTQGSDLFEAIRQHISYADFCLADFTPDRGPHPNLNVLTEAGVALGMQKNVYIIARGTHEAVKGGLPSDWSGHYIEYFPEKGTDSWPGLLSDLFEKILTELDRPVSLAPEPHRTTDAQVFSWVLNVVRRLRHRCRDLYETVRTGPTWTDRKHNLGGLPSQFVFWLTSAAAEDVAVGVGAFFERWQREQLPFGIEIQHKVDGITKKEWVPILDLGTSIYTCTTDQAIDVIIRELDARLALLTHGLDRPTHAARIIASFGPMYNAIKQVCESHCLLLRQSKRSRWTDDGFLEHYLVSSTAFMLTVGIDFALWAEKDRSPLWIRIEPRPSQPAEILGKLRLRKSLREINEPGAKLVSVPIDGDVRKDLVARIDEIVQACHNAAPLEASPTDELETALEFEDEPGDSAGVGGDDPQDTAP